MLTSTRRFTDITSEQSMLQTHSQSNPIPGTVMMKSYFTTDNRKLETSLRRHIGRAIGHPQIRSSQLGFWELANSLRSLLLVWMILGSTDMIFMGYIMICWDFCQMMPMRKLASGLRRMSSRVKLLGWLSMACSTHKMMSPY
jgi:hypothetical protein